MHLKPTPTPNTDLYQRNYARTDRLMLTAISVTVVDVVINPSLVGITTLTVSTFGMSAIFFRRELEGLFKIITKFSHSLEEGRRQEAEGRRLNSEDLKYSWNCRTVNLRFAGNIKSKFSSFRRLSLKIISSCLSAVATTRGTRATHCSLPSAFCLVRRTNKITLSVLILWSAFLLLEALESPVHAQFFQSAETWMTGQFTGAEEAITLSFNVLRGLFILYLGISLVRVIQAARQDEDWQNLARTPMIILIAVTMGDILANLIIGGGGGQ